MGSGVLLKIRLVQNLQYFKSDCKAKGSMLENFRSIA